MSNNISAKVTSARAGRAPYNFVPMPGESVQGAWMEPPEQDRYDRELLSGEIQCRITALTPFYVRGMWSWKQALEAKKRDHPLEPFQAAGGLRLPGTSIAFL